MDGVIDGDACDRGAGLFYGEKQGWVYLAADLAAPADAFLYVSSNPTGLGPMNWAKSGQVASYDLFLAREGTNAFAGWFDTSALLTADTSRRAFARNGNVLEGAVRKDLLAATGPLHIALGLFGTADGGALICSGTAESTNADANIDCVGISARVQRAEPDGLDRVHACGNRDRALVDRAGECADGVPGIARSRVRPRRRMCRSTGTCIQRRDGHRFIDGGARERGDES
jgi:hypothetical protein